MFELTSTWPNFAFDQLFTLSGTNNDHILIPNVNVLLSDTHNDNIWVPRCGEVILSIARIIFNFTKTGVAPTLPIWNGSQLDLPGMAKLSYFDYYNGAIDQQP